MTLSEAQLQAWASAVGSTAAKQSHESIRSALADLQSPIRELNYSVFLQGSYKNDTNIRGDSDVDVVVRFDTYWYRDISRLSQWDLAQYQSWAFDAPYGWKEFRSDVLVALQRYYGSGAINGGGKCITVVTGQGRMTADVVPCLPHRLYLSFPQPATQQYIEGIEFFAGDGITPIINYPVQHYENGCAKNGDWRTNGRYKPAVRMIKNARNHLIERYFYPSEHAPSYFIECLLYNVPDDRFSGTLAEAFQSIVYWLTSVELSGFACQNGITPLFGTTSTTWRLEHAREFVGTLRALWANG